jgi:hypothetical protein
MSVITVNADSNNINVSTITTAGGVSVSSASVVSSNTVSQTDPDGVVSIKLPTEVTNNIILSSTVSTNSISVITDAPSANVISINQGQQGPAGSPGGNGIASVLNYDNNRLVTSTSTETILNARSNLLFDGSILSINGTGVSISGHQHLSSSITDLNSSIDSRVAVNFSNIPDIVNLCDLSYILVKDVSNNFKLINKTNLVNIITEIDGGGVVNSNC